MVPIESMLLFVDVVKQHSFAKAAKQHNLTAAAVSKRIAQLEQQMNVKLLLRSTRKLQLTPPGELLYQKCLKLAAEVQNTYNLVLDSNQRLQGCVRLSAQTLISHLFLAPLLAKLSQEQPELSFDMQLRDARQLPEFGSYDISLVSGELNDSSINIRKLAELPFTLCASPTYLKQHGEPKQPADLTNFACLDYHYRETVKLWKFKQENKTIEVAIQPTLLTNNASFIIEAALNAGGIIYVPSFSVVNYLKTKRLKPLLLNYQTTSMPLWLATHLKQKQLPPKVQFVIEAIINELTNLSLTF